MKNLKYIVLFLLLPIILYSCTDKMTTNNPQQGDVKENKYPSSEDAVQNGKNDLMALLKNKSFNIDIDAAALEKSIPNTPIPVYEVNFERLLTSENDSLATISEDSRKLNTPLVTENKVIAVITTSKIENGWQLNEITNPSLSNDLNEIRGSLQMNAPISVYEVPNINATLYEAKMDGRAMYFTNYKGQSLRQPVPGDSLMKQLRVDAQVFQRKFGEQLKKGPLVK